MTRKIDRDPPLLRAFALLEHVAHAQGAVSLQEMTEAAALPKPTVYRMLNVLEQAGLIAREPDGRRVVAGPRLARLALDVLMNDLGARAAARDPAAARRRSRRDRQPDDARARRSRLPRSRRKRVAAAHGAAAGLARAAALHRQRQAAAGAVADGAAPPHRRAAAIGAAHRQHDHRPRAASNPKLAAIRRAGFATDNEEYLAGVVCVAVPVMARGGRVAASVAVHAPGRADDARSRAVARAGVAARRRRARRCRSTTSLSRQARAATSTRTRARPHAQSPRDNAHDAAPRTAGARSRARAIAGQR